MPSSIGSGSKSTSIALQARWVDDRRNLQDEHLGTYLLDAASLKYTSILSDWHCVSLWIPWVSTPDRKKLTNVNNVENQLCSSDISLQNAEPIWLPETRFHCKAHDEMHSENSPHWPTWMCTTSLMKDHLQRDQRDSTMPSSWKQDSWRSNLCCFFEQFIPAILLLGFFFFTVVHMQQEERSSPTQFDLYFASSPIQVKREMVFATRARIKGSVSWCWTCLTPSRTWIPIVVPGQILDAFSHFMLSQHKTRCRVPGNIKWSGWSQQTKWELRTLCSRRLVWQKSDHTL